jgi:putative tricarboxylic transport membrane protein
MYLGNLFLLVLNLPLLGMWVRLLRVATSILYPMIILFCIIGAYSVNNNLFDVGMLFFFGGLGYVLRKFNFDLVPLIMGFILGPIIENSARQSLIMSRGQFGIFFSSTISAILLGLAMVIIAAAVYSGMRKRKV